MGNAVNALVTESLMAEVFVAKVPESWGLRSFAWCSVDDGFLSYPSPQARVVESNFKGLF